MALASGPIASRAFLALAANPILWEMGLYSLLARVAVPRGDEEPLVQVGREELERELLVVPRVVVGLDERRPARRLVRPVGDERDLFRQRDGQSGGRSVVCGLRSVP